MSRFTVLAASGLLASAMMAAPAFAATDSFGQACYNPNVDGSVNTNAYPVCAEALPESNQYPTLDRTTTFRGQPCAAGVDCGAPAELSNVKPFYNSAASAPVQTVAVPQPTTAVVQTAQAAAAAPSAAYAAVPFAAAGLSNTALAVGAVGAAALAGLIAVAANDDNDDNSATATTN